MTDAPAPAEPTVAVRTGPPAGRARLSPPRVATAPVVVHEATPEPVADAPAAAPASAPAPKAEPAVAVPRGRGRLRLSPPPVAAPSVVEVATSAATGAPEPDAVPAASEVPTPPVEPAPAPRGPAPGRARLSTATVARRDPIVRVSTAVGRVSRDGTATTERVVPRASRDPIVRAAQAAREAEIDRELREADAPPLDDEDVTFGEPDPEPVPEPVEAALVEAAVYPPRRNPVSRMRPHAVHGPKLPRAGDPAFVGPPRFGLHGDHSVPFH